jgi:abequosyltransferase
MNLSICIATYNRGRFIGETLDSIVGQLRPGVEVVIVDGASPDETPSVVSAYAERYPSIRYFREAENSGVDGDYDKAVGYARGTYCWLFPDDDLLAPGAVDRVLATLRDGATDVLVVDVEIRDAAVARRLVTGRLRFTGERNYRSEDADAFLGDAGDALSFIGGAIVRREFWLARERRPYFGSLFVHVGVIFQAPVFAHATVLGEPLVIIRAGNSMWRTQSFDIWAFKWPALIWSLEAYSDAAKRRVTPAQPWKGLVWILYFRALGAYSLVDYRLRVARERFSLGHIPALLVSVMPGALANVLGIVFLILIGRGGGHGTYELAACSRFSNPVGRALARPWLGPVRGPAR